MNDSPVDCQSRRPGRLQAVAEDAVIVPDKAEKTTYFGASVAGGLGGGADIHVTWGETVPVFNWSFNIFDVIESVLY